jgi:hypothetical protein
MIAIAERTFASMAHTMDRIATLHVVRERQRRHLVVLGRMLTDRRRLAAVDGLVVAKVLGTGRGEDTAPSADLLRQAYVLVWRDAAAAQRFLVDHPIARRWESLTVEHQLGLRLVSGHGTWSGRAILDGMQPSAAEGEVIALTRARIRVRSWRSFRRASRRTAVTLRRAPGLRWTLGVGELPVGLLGTLSCWRSVADLDAFLAADGAHTDAAVRAPEWFAESLFARFTPFDLSAGNQVANGTGPTGRVT